MYLYQNNTKAEDGIFTDCSMILQDAYQLALHMINEDGPDLTEVADKCIIVPYMTMVFRQSLKLAILLRQADISVNTYLSHLQSQKEKSGTGPVVD